jgi:hypothetical protein
VGVGRPTAPIMPVLALMPLLEVAEFEREAELRCANAAEVVAFGCEWGA